MPNDCCGKPVDWMEQVSDEQYEEGLFTVDRESAKVLGPRNSIPAIVIYVLSIFLVFVNVYLSLGCFLLVPVLYFVPNIIRFQ